VQEISNKRRQETKLRKTRQKTTPGGPEQKRSYWRRSPESVTEHILRSNLGDAENESAEVRGTHAKKKEIAITGEGFQSLEAGSTRENHIDRGEEARSVRHASTRRAEEYHAN